MSENGTLISYNRKITREELACVPTPPATPTHQPIPHHRVVEALVESLSYRLKEASNSFHEVYKAFGKVIKMASLPKGEPLSGLLRVLGKSGS